MIEPAAVDAESYFTPFQLDRAEDFRSLQRLIGAGGLLVSTGTLVLLAWRPPRRLFDGLARRPILGAAAAGAGISVLLLVTGLPLSAWSHQRAVDVGLSTQGWTDWLGDVAKSGALGAAFAAVGGALALALVRRFRRHWWAPAAVVVVAFGVVTIWLFPVVIDPLFNDFEKLPPGPTRSDVLELARKAHVDVGEVYRVDASRRTTAANAYVNGLGHSKRVVLFDNLISSFPRDQVRLVVAHELGHQKHDDLLRGLAWLALVAPAGTFLAQRLAEAFAGRFGLGEPGRRPGPIVLPAIALSVALVSFGMGAASNVLSREVEASADAFSLRITRDPGSFVQFQRRLVLRNVSDPDPPAVWQLLFGTHPTGLERIGMGEAFKQTE
jgi:Zn-dependent protease with chaperone function